MTHMYVTIESVGLPVWTDHYCDSSFHHNSTAIEVKVIVHCFGFYLSVEILADETVDLFN